MRTLPPPLQSHWACHTGLLGLVEHPHPPPPPLPPPPPTMQQGAATFLETLTTSSLACDPADLIGHMLAAGAMGEAELTPEQVRGGEEDGVC